MSAVLISDALLAGAVLCVASLGLSLSYAIFRFPNFAHAEYLTVGAYGALVGFAATVPVLGEPAAFAAAAVTAIAASVIVTLLAARFIFEPLGAHARGPALIIAAFATGLLVRNLVVLVFGPTERQLQRDLEIASPIGLGVRLTPTEIAILLSTGLLVLALHLVLRHSTLGRCLRAIAENPQLAGVTGIPVDALRMVAWGIAGLCCALSGFALSLLGPVRPETGYEYLLPALAAVILGGLGSIYGTLLGALAIGLAEATAVHSGFAEWRQVISFMLIIALLLVRPRGLLERAP